MRRAQGSALLFFLSSFALLSSGRLASSDAGQQLQVAVMVALTGEMGTSGEADGPPSAGWIQAPNGRLYQAHDIGNVLMMLPAAALGGWSSTASATAQIASPPPITRALVSVTCAAMAALGCWWFFRLCEEYYPRRVAFALAVAFPATTLVLPYARGAWDVLGACVFLTGTMYYSAAMLRSISAFRSAVLAAATLAAAISFRFSLAPFIVFAALFVFVRARASLRSRALLVSAIAFVVCAVPALAYNHLRTGSPFRPGSAAAQYRDTTAALTGDVLDGLYGLFLSPNRGLFVFCPVLLLALALPWSWRHFRSDQRLLLASYGAGAAAYVLMIANMEQWHSSFGWGPRYLVPVLPIVVFAAAASAMAIWRRARVAVLLLAVLSLLLTLPAGLVNWHLATTHFDAGDAYATRPLQIQAAWRTLLMGIRGVDLPAPAPLDHPERATTGQFPDLLLVRAFRHSPSTRLPALAAGALAAGVMLVCARRVLVEGAPASSGPAAGVHDRR